MSVAMKPITDSAGNLRPDLDFRYVPVALMARYLGVSKQTLWRHTANGLYERGVKRVGRINYYQPRVMVSEAVA